MESLLGAFVLYVEGRQAGWHNALISGFLQNLFFLYAFFKPLENMEFWIDVFWAKGCLSPGYTILGSLGCRFCPFLSSAQIQKNRCIFLSRKSKGEGLLWDIFLSALFLPMATCTTHVFGGVRKAEEASLDLVDNFPDGISPP